MIDKFGLALDWQQLVILNLVRLHWGFPLEPPPVASPNHNFQILANKDRRKQTHKQLYLNLKM